MIDFPATNISNPFQRRIMTKYQKTMIVRLAIVTASGLAVVLAPFAWLAAFVIYFVE